MKLLSYVEEMTKLLKKETSKKSANKPKSLLIFPGASISKKELRNKLANKLNRLYIFLVHLPYYMNKSIIIHVFYCPWCQHCIIWVMDMRRNKSSGVRIIIFWKFIIKDECNYSVIFFWDITNKKTKKDSIIVFSNVIHPRHMIYFGMCLII